MSTRVESGTSDLGWELVETCNFETQKAHEAVQANISQLQSQIASVSKEKRQIEGRLAVAKFRLCKSTDECQALKLQIERTQAATAKMRERIRDKIHTESETRSTKITELKQRLHTQDESNLSILITKRAYDGIIRAYKNCDAYLDEVLQAQNSEPTQNA
jgi:septal ring factor EnvC (AmiA/AmiB activator)